MSVGTVVVNEIVYPIVDLNIIAHGFEIVFKIGPDQDFDPGDGHYAVFAADGQLSYEGCFTTTDFGQKLVGEDVTWLFHKTLFLTDDMTEGAKRRLAR